MNLFDQFERYIETVIKCALTLLLLWGLSMVLFEIRAFWHDEWRLIYNLKFKSHEQLWGRLDYTQQFPRVYLQLTKAFAAWFNYSYFSLRFPAFFLGTVNVFFCWKLMKTICQNVTIERYLFVMMVVSNFTFIEYLTQTKHYQMEIFMSLLAIWQLLEVIDVSDKGIINRLRYSLVCLTFLIAPFFSYTYPIAAAPIYFVVFMELFLWYDPASLKRGERWMIVLPLVFLSTGMFVFYQVDVCQLMNDREMTEFWKFRMADEEDKLISVIKNLWGWFAKMGSGFVFEIVFGVLGFTSLFYCLYKHLHFFRRSDPERAAKIIVYCICLVVVVLALFFAGKLPLSEPKFNAFTIPALSLIIIFFLYRLRLHQTTRRFSRGLLFVLLIALIVNIITSIINTFTLPEYNRRIGILHSTNRMLVKAQQERLPVFVTPGVAYADDITIYMPGMKMITADVILKTFPGYNAKSNLPVFAIDDVSHPDIVLKKVPDSVRRFIAGNGLVYKVYQR